MPFVHLEAILHRPGQPRFIQVDSGSRRYDGDYQLPPANVMAFLYINAFFSSQFATFEYLSTAKSSKRTSLATRGT